MSFPGSSYAPPGVYVETKFENPLGQSIDSLRIPVLVGEGNEILTHSDMQLVRGSSSDIDQERAFEDQTNRAVTHMTAAGLVTLGALMGRLIPFRYTTTPS